MKKIFFLLLFTNILFAQDKGWRFFGNMNNPVAGGKAICQYDNIYVFGGYSKTEQANVTWIQRYATYSNYNEVFASMKVARYGLEVSLLNNKFYIAGGVHDSAKTNNTLEILDSSYDGLTSVVKSDSNFNRIFSTGVFKDSLFYLIGGHPYSEYDDTDTISYIVECNVNSDLVCYKSNSSTSKFPEQQMSVIAGDNIYIFGGVFNGVLQTIFKFNIPTRKLDTLDVELLEPRAGGGAVYNAEEKNVYIIGGFNEGNPALKSVEIFTINDNGSYSITKGHDLLEARTKPMVVSTWDGKIFALGGFDKNGEVLSSIEVFGKFEVVGIDNNSSLPILFCLKQNYPNPFNPSTTIRYSIPLNKNMKEVAVKLSIYDILGSKVATLINKRQSAGTYEVVFNADDLVSGVYLYQLRVGSFVETKKMTVLK